jgi:hypothetical protein
VSNGDSGTKNRSVSSFPEVIFLGFAERATYVRDGETNLSKWNVQGLKNVLLANFFPSVLSDWKLGLAIQSPSLNKDFRIKFKADSGEEIGWIQGTPTVVPLVGVSPAAPGTGPESKSLGIHPGTWLVVFLDFPPAITMVVQKPGRYFVVLERDYNENIIGEFHYALVDPPPLTAERVAAIKSDPQAVKAVRAVLGCGVCSSKFQVYAALERDPNLEAEGFKWYAEIPDRFTCQCGKTQFDVSTYRRNFHALLGERRQALSGEIRWTPLYEKNAIESLRLEFLNLIKADPPEETLQGFIERNPILLHQFPAERLFFKPPILTRYKADFAVVTPQKELVLIEIERTSTNLLKSDGGQHSQLTHAIGQVLNWLHETDEHRLAVLSALEIASSMVSKVRGVVIAGRDAGNDASHLRRLKGSDLGRVTLLTYDDLIAALATLAQRLGDL